MNERRSASYQSSKLTPLCQGDARGQGVQAQAPIQAGEVLVIWGGDVHDAASFATLPDDLRRHSLQIEDEAFMVPRPPSLVDFINHSCEPNTRLSGQIVLVAGRDISAGEQICYDYAMTDGSPYDEFVCQCGSRLCRGRVTSEDWRRPELWQRYGSAFSPYLQRRIAALRAEAQRPRG